jgi:hypothetical protein
MENEYTYQNYWAFIVRQAYFAIEADINNAISDLLEQVAA